MHQFKKLSPKARALRAEGRKRAIEAKALADVIGGREPDGDGSKYLTCYRLAVAAWQSFLGLRESSRDERRTATFGRYMKHLKTIEQAIMGRGMGTLKIVPMPEPRTVPPRDRAVGPIPKPSPAVLPLKPAAPKPAPTAPAPADIGVTKALINADDLETPQEEFDYSPEPDLDDLEAGWASRHITDDD